MGSDDLFRKRRAERQKRKHEFKSPRANSFLIVTEGKRTEPLYFKGIQKQIEKRIGGTINITEAPFIDIQGEGCSTSRLIDIAVQIVKDAKIFYQNVWLVFDKDDFEDFDAAIKEAKRKGYKVAWSNQSFEYWLFLHFNYSDSALHRKVWSTKLNELFQQYNLGDGTYHKNYTDIFNMVTINDGMNTAIKNAQRRMSGFNNKKISPSVYDPGTTVHKLVQDLKRYLDE